MFRERKLKSNLSELRRQRPETEDVEVARVFKAGHYIEKEVQEFV